MSLTLRRWVQIMVRVLLAVMLLFIGAVMTSSGESIRTQVSGSYESSMRLYARILEKDLRSVELSVTNLLNDDTKILFQIERDGDVLARLDQLPGIEGIQEVDVAMSTAYISIVRARIRRPINTTFGP